MKIELKNIANIHLGYSFRSKIQKENNGNVFVIQMKDLTKEFGVDVNNLDKTEIPDIKAHYLMRKNDLIFKTRGLDTTASILDKDLINIILSAPLLRIRIESKNVLPEYVFWYINQAPAQIFLNRRAKGTFQKMITKQVLEELEIEIPPLELQRKIVKVVKLAEREQRILENLRIKKNELVSAILLNSIK